jgi:predicted ATPase
MYKTFSVRHFRGLHDLSISPLKRINLIAGKNGVGKTALLEALRLYQSFDEPLTAVKVSRSRGLPWQIGNGFLFDLFENFEQAETIELTARDDSNLASVLRIGIKESSRSLLPPEPRSETSLDQDSVEPDLDEDTELTITFERKAPVRKVIRTQAHITAKGASSFTGKKTDHPKVAFLADMDRFESKGTSDGLSRLIELKKLDSVVRVLKMIEPSLKTLQVIQKGRSIGVYADIGMKRLVPTQLLGDGFSRLLRIIVEIPQVEGGLLLIDEIENGIHYSIQLLLWKEIAALCREHDVQLFATTHSEECVRYAHEYFAKTKQYDFRLHRLERTKQTVTAINFNKEQLQTAFETGWEFR